MVSPQETTFIAQLAIQEQGRKYKSGVYEELLRDRGNSKQDKREVERKYKSLREWHRAYRAAKRRSVPKGKGEPEATVRGRGQRETENTRVTKRGNKEREQK